MLHHRLLPLSLRAAITTTTATATTSFAQCRRSGEFGVYDLNGYWKSIAHALMETTDGGGGGSGSGGGGGGFPSTITHRGNDGITDEAFF